MKIIGREYYDKGYTESENYKKHYRDMIYLPMWDYIFKKVKNRKKILDIGCGPSHFGQMLFDNGEYEYVGIDFSQVALGMAKDKTPSYKFIQSDLMDVDYGGYAGYTIVATEVFEHLIDDRSLISMLPAGEMFFSVPNFKDRAHYRTYENEKYIRKYYGGILQISEIKRFNIKGRSNIYCVSCEKI